MRRPRGQGLAHRRHRDGDVRQTGEHAFRIAALYRRADAVGQYVISMSAYAANFPQQLDARVFISKAKDVTAADARRAVEALTAAYPNATLQDQTEFKAAQAAQINKLLGLIYVLLALAIVIAWLGIMNTLALSIFERTASSACYARSG